MTDIQLETTDPFTKILVEQWFKAKDEVDNIDEKMAVESFGRTKLLNNRYSEANPGLDDLRKSKPNNPIAATIRELLSADGLSDEEFAGLYETIRRTLPEFEERLNKYVDASLPKVDDSDKPSPAELEAFRADRKVQVDNMNGIRQLLEGTNPDWWKLEGDKLLPKIDNLRGAVGGREKTGKRLGTYQFTVTDPNGTVTPLTERKLGAIPAYAPLKKHVKNVGDVWKAIMASNPDFDRDNQPENFEFMIADFKIVAQRMTDESSESDEDENTEDIDELTLDVSDDSPEDFETEDDDTSALFDDE